PVENLVENFGYFFVRGPKRPDQKSFLVFPGRPQIVGLTARSPGKFDKSYFLAVGLSLEFFGGIIFE
ncbi:MAG: hypothetical protein AAB288_03490, partial [Acidobacteriota bacterium]